MSQSFPSSNVPNDAERLFEGFDPVYVQRGLTYLREGRVLEASARGGAIHGRVRGSGRNVYDVRVHVAGYLARSGCSCPVSVDCKHGVAVLAAYLGNASSEHSPNPLTAQTRQWLSDLGQAAGTLRSQPVNERLIYVLRHALGAGVQFDVHRTRLRKDGSYGRTTPYRGDGRSGAAFLRPADERLLHWLGAGPFGLGAPPPRALTAPVMQELVALGRAHYGATTGPVLRPGGARRGTFGWRMDTHGRQRLRLRVAGVNDAVIVPGVPLWYVEPDTGRAGEVTTDLPERIAATLAESPDVDPDEVAALIRPLRDLGVDLPMPRQPERRTVRGATPVPHLILERRAPVTEPATYRRGRNSHVPEPTARLEFLYEGMAVDANDVESTVTRQHDGVLWQIERDRAAEHRAFARLRRLDLESVHAGPGANFRPARSGNWPALVLNGVAELRADGWRITIAEDFPYRVVTPQTWYADVDGEADSVWFDLELGVEIDGKRHPLLPLLMQLIRHQPDAMSQAHLNDVDPHASLVLELGDGRLLPVPAARIAPILRTLTELYDPERSPDADQLTLSRLSAAGIMALDGPDTPLRWEGNERLRGTMQRLASLGRITPANAPAALHGELRDYQREGVGWLQRLGELELGGVLADDMGLGKTIQVLTHLLLDKEAGISSAPSLVVAPTSLLFNWQNEAARFTPALRVLMLHGPKRRALMEDLPNADLVLTSYALVHRDIHTLAQQRFHVCVLDEAQAVKNPAGKTAQAVRRLRSRQRVCLTGTPLENHLGELWAQFDFLLPDLLGDRHTFNRLYRRPIEKGDEGRQASLRGRLAPFLLRRTKESVAPELPAKTEIQRYAELRGGQRDLYETVRTAMHERVRREITRRGLASSRIVILDALLKLRQVCCDPRLVKLDAARTVTVSAKLERLMVLLPKLIEEGRRVLLFSQFTGMLELIETALAPTGIPYVKLTGRTKDRETRVGRFQNGEVPLFLISLKAGGTGLNLTAADTVIHYDPWWNPAVTRQATDRAHRIGQTRPVFVYHLLAKDTVEEKMLDLQQRKAALGESLLGGAGGNLAALAMEDVESLFEPLV